MMNNIKKKMKLFRYLDKPIVVDTCNGNESERYNDFIKEKRNQRSPILIKSFTKAKQEIRESTGSSQFKLRCRSALNQSISFKPKGERISAPLNRASLPYESYQQSPKSNVQFSQTIKCKQILKQSNRIHQDRWHLLSSIESKLVQEMQNNILKRQKIKNRYERLTEKSQDLKAKSAIKFNDLIQIKQVEVEKQTQKRQGKKTKMFANKIKKKSALLSRTQCSFRQEEDNRRSLGMGSTWKFFSRNQGRLSINQQQITGWQTAVDL